MYVECEKTLEMINGETHKNRVITKDQFAKVREIQEALKKDAVDYGWKLVESVKEQLSNYINKN